MVLPKTVYKMIEDIVGPEHVTENPANLAAYRRGMFPSEPPAAVVMPKSTEEVQALVKICNRYKIRYNCFVTMGATCPEPGMILLDLKRMNRIIEINEKDMYAIVEPAVTVNQLKAECMKRGLQNIAKAVVGSALRPAATWGHGHLAQRYSDASRHGMGCEWVMPTGDILRLGSLGTGAGWFCSAGPGPSLRGLLTGGTMGIVTKVAIRIFPWQGPRVLRVEGATPNYRTVLPEDRFKLLHFKMPSLEKLCDALYEIGKAEVGASVMKDFNWPSIIEGSSTMEEVWEKVISGYFHREMMNLITVWLQAWSRKELEYQEKVVRAIIAEMGGEEAPKEVYEATRSAHPDGILLGIPSCRSQRTGGFSSTGSGEDSIDCCAKWRKGLPDFAKEFIEKGLLLDARDSFWIVSHEYGHIGLDENLIFGDPTIPEMREAMMDYIKKLREKTFKEGFPFWRLVGGGPDELWRWGPSYGNVHLWMVKIKKALDPNLVSNPKAHPVGWTPEG